MSKSRKVAMKITDLVVDVTLNDRDPSNIEVTWDLPTMRRQIAQFRRITDPIHFERRLVTGRETEGLLPVVLKGNRRTMGGQWWCDQPDCPADLLANLQKVDCLEWSELEDFEREEMIADKGSALPLARYEIVLAIWRMASKASDFLMSDTKDRIRLTNHQLLASFTGNEAMLKAKLDKLDRSEVGYEAAKLKILQTHFHGTLDNVIMGVFGMGTYIREQYILSLKKEQNKLQPSDPKPEINVSTKRITELSKARTADQKGKGWLADSGGEKFNELVNKFKGEDSGTIAKNKSTRPSIEDLMAMAGNIQHPTLAKVVKRAAGIDNEQTSGLTEEMDEAYRQYKIMQLLTKAAPELPKEFKDLVNALLSASPAKFQEFVRDTYNINVDL